MDNRKFLKPYRPRFASRKDYSHHKTFGAVIVQLPAELIKLPDVIQNQGSKPSCTAMASVTCRNIMTGKQYDGEAQWQLELKTQGVKDGEVEGFGLDVPAKIGKDIGFIPVGQTEPTDKVGGYFWKNSKLSGMDWFDTLRTVQYQLFQKTGKIIPFQFGINWYREWETALNGFIPATQNILLGGHDTTWAGYKTFPDGIIRGGNPNTWGTNYGDKGVFWFDRETTNKNIGKFPIFYWLDKEDMPEEVFRLGIFLAILQNIKTIFQLLLTNFQNKSIIKPVQPITPDSNNVPPVPAPPTYDWSNPISARHSVRVLCDEEGLPTVSNISVNGKFYSAKDIICACIQQESEFLVNPPPNKNNKNKNGTSDWGLCQFNDGTYLAPDGTRKPIWIGQGADFPSTDYVLANPEKAVKVMIREYKMGHISKWSSYLTGAYKKWL